MNKKYLTVLCDGMADYPGDDGKTPMDVAHKPVMDRLCADGICGLVKTVPDGMKPGSDVCNLAALGYDPQSCYTGRSPLEALSMGIPLDGDDVTYRINLVTLSEADDLHDRQMIDYSAGEISSAEAEQLINALKPLFASAGNGTELYAGVSYRHAAVIRGGSLGTEFTPPHDILGKNIGDHLPQGICGELFRSLIKNSIDVLKDHPVNIDRIKSGKRPATAVWPWGEGTKPLLVPFREMTGKSGAVVSAVDLVKGIGVAGAMRVLNVPTATGTVDTDYEAKTEAALGALVDNDFVFVHLEGPDECGHQGDRKGKITAIERIDERILKPLYLALQKSGNPFAIAVMPDHATPLSVRTHTRDLVPFFIYDSETPRNGGKSFSEKNAATTGVKLDRGSDVIRALFGTKTL